MIKFMYENYRLLITCVVLVLSFSAFGNIEELDLGSAIEKNAKEMKTAIVSGANRGQGLGWVQHYLKEGYDVIATARKPESASELIKLKKQYKDKLLIEKLDVTNESDMAALSAKLKKENIKIGIAISNAGVTVEEDFGEWTADSFETNFRINTMGAAFFAQLVAPYLVDGAKLIQISTGGAGIANQKNSSALDPYIISKVGLNMLTKKLSIRLADRNIIVVSMAPGGVKTDMNPNAKTSIEEAIAIMSETVSKLTIENSGTFINNTGKELPW